MPQILLTGPPGCGKTTIIRKVVLQLSIPAGGFYTQELRDAHSNRLGFEILTLDGQRGVLAHVDFRSPQRVGRYGVDLAALDSLAVEAVRRALESGSLVVIDEIGPMELLSPRFRTVVLDALESRSSLLATVVQRSTPFTDALKRRQQVTLLEVRPDNREALPARILSLLI
jgi:nucleoside-triphosphatase